MVASDGASIPAPLAIPPTVQLPGWCSATCLGTVSVVMMARAASSPPVRPPAISCTSCTTPASTLSIGSRSPIKPVEHTATSIAPVSVPHSDNAAATAFGGGVGVLEAARSGTGVGAAGIQDHRAQPPVGQHLLASTTPARP